MCEYTRDSARTDPSARRAMALHGEAREKRRQEPRSAGKGRRGWPFQHLGPDSRDYMRVLGVTTIESLQQELRHGEAIKCAHRRLAVWRLAMG